MYASNRQSESSATSVLIGHIVGNWATMDRYESPKRMIGLLSILAVGFFLGMRHATEPDHVIAVTTIVSNQRNSMRAALIGAFWGAGHTLTIFVVGAGIILFNLVIPVRVGLGMEFSVAVMLIILGLMNVAGFLRSMPAGSTHIDEGERVAHSHSHSHG